MFGDGVILAFDIGTSSLRTALFGSSATLVAGSNASRAYTLTTEREGQAELDPQELMEAARDALGETLAGSDLPIVAVGASSLWHSLVGLDAQG